jgi:hypothetical protein
MATAFGAYRVPPVYPPELDIGVPEFVISLTPLADESGYPFVTHTFPIESIAILSG